MNDFKPPEAPKMATGKDLFIYLAGAVLIAINVIGVFWALLIKKPGTVGTRAYWFDLIGGQFLLLALSQSYGLPDRFAFQFSMGLLAFVYFWHFTAAMRSKSHVHRQCVGGSRFGGGRNVSQAMELVTGVAVGISLCLVGLVPFGIFVCSSAFAACCKEGLIQERDRQRSAQMADAMWEQDYMVKNFENWKRGQHG